MIERWYKKGLVVGIIVLFISVSVAPSINANIDRLPSKSKLIETSIRIHRANSIIPYTVKLSEKESDTAESIFDKLKICLDSAETGEEIDECYDEAVESLYELGLFPRMTVEEAKQLVKGDRQNLNGKSQPDNIGNGDVNFNCQISGVASECLQGFLGRLFMGGLLFLFIQILIKLIGLDNVPFFIGRISYIALGANWDGDWYYPSRGWVHTNGTNGVIKWEGEFFGDIDYWEIENEHHGYEWTEGFYKGVTEFNGLWIQIGQWSPCNFLGNAKHVKLSRTPSWP
jgi:hypothetical protein